MMKMVYLGSLSAILAQLLLMCYAIDGGRLTIKLVQYDNPDGQDMAGNPCDGEPDGSSSPCDTYFDVCIDTPEGDPSSMVSCALGRQSTPPVEANSIQFDDLIGPQPNRFHFGYGNLLLDETARAQFKLEVFDRDDDGSGDDLIDRLSLVEQLPEPAVNGGTPTPVTVQLQARTRLTLELSVTCDVDWYGRLCGEYCRPRDDHIGHYTCDNNGTKVCLPGWKGRWCTTESDPCDSSPCQNGGQCENIGNDYLCVCFDGFTGKSCEIPRTTTQEVLESTTEKIASTVRITTPNPENLAKLATDEHSTQLASTKVTDFESTTQAVQPTTAATFPTTQKIDPSTGRQEKNDRLMFVLDSEDETSTFSTGGPTESETTESLSESTTVLLDSSSQSQSTEIEGYLGNYQAVESTSILNIAFLDETETSMGHLENQTTEQPNSQEMSTTKTSLSTEDIYDEGSGDVDSYTEQADVESSGEVDEDGWLLVTTVRNNNHNEDWSGQFNVVVKDSDEHPTAPPDLPLVYAIHPTIVMEFTGWMGPTQRKDLRQQIRTATAEFLGVPESNLVVHHNFTTCHGIKNTWLSIYSLSVWMGQKTVTREALYHVVEKHIVSELPIPLNTEDTCREVRVHAAKSSPGSSGVNLWLYVLIGLAGLFVAVIAVALVAKLIQSRKDDWRPLPSPGVAVVASHDLPYRKRMTSLPVVEGGTVAAAPAFPATPYPADNNLTPPDSDDKPRKKSYDDRFFGFTSFYDFDYIDEEK